MQLKSPISLKFGLNVGFGEEIIVQNSRSKYFVPFKLGGSLTEKRPFDRNLCIFKTKSTGSCCTTIILKGKITSQRATLISLRSVASFFLVLSGVLISL